MTEEKKAYVWGGLRDSEAADDFYLSAESFENNFRDLN